MAKTNAVWGIDIGQCAIKALRCKLDADGQTIVADKYDYIEYPKILNQPEADPDELVRQALEEFLSRNQVLGDEVAISVPGQAGLSRFFKPPPVDAKTLPDIVRYEVKQQIPFPIEDVIWDWQQLGGTIVDGRTVDAEVGLFAMKREAVLRQLRPFNEADIGVDLIQLSPLAVFNFVCHEILEEIPDPVDFDPEAPPESLVVMSMGTDTTDLIVTNGIKLWLRNIPIGGNHFTKHLAREMKMTQAKAEHLKRNASQAEDPKSIFKAMRPVFNDLVNEVQRSLTFFQSMEKTATISKIVLLGNAAKLPGLRQYLNKQLELDIAKVTRFEKLQGDDVVNQPTFKDNLLAFAPSYGLCIQGLDQGVLKTNLLPGEIVKERIIRAKKPWVLASVGLLMVALLAGFWPKFSAWWTVDPRHEVQDVSWAEAQKAVDRQEKISKKFVLTDNQLKDKLTKLNRLAEELVSASEEKSTWIEIQSAIYQALPKDPRLEGLESVDPNEIGFEDREEIYIDYIETKYFKDLNEWFTQIKPIYDTMSEVSLEEVKAGTQPESAEVQDAKRAAKQASQQVTDDLKGPGWVIEINAHHFHNSDQMVIKRDSDRAFVLRTLWKTLVDGDVKFPGEETPVAGGGVYKFRDFGIFYPVIVESSERIETTINFNPEIVGRTNTEDARGGGPGSSGAASPSDKDGVFKVYRYNFTIQMAWIPRTPQERFQPKQERLKAEAEAAQKSEPPTDPNGQPNNRAGAPPAKTDE